MIEPTETQLIQLDGNVSVITDDLSDSDISPSNDSPMDRVPNEPLTNRVSHTSDRISCALSLPTIATYNCRSLFPKLGNVKKILWRGL